MPVGDNLNTLYPPIVPTYAPTFLIDSEYSENNVCIIPFSISKYNPLKTIKNAQVTIVYQDTNISALSESKYPTGIMITNIEIDQSLAIGMSNRYYIKIYPSDLEHGFELNTYYKVQIRFTNIDAPDINTSKMDTWLMEYLHCFSEWSRVILVRGISTPTLTIDNFDKEAESTLYTATSVELYGRLIFADSTETDTLKYYRIKVYTEAGDLVADSQNQYPININEIDYAVKYSFVDGQEYRLELEYTTQNLYSGTNEYKFVYFDIGYDKANITLSPILDEENGRIGLQLGGELTRNITHNLVFRRTSAESNFQVWEDVKNVTIEGTYLNYIWYDYTIKSGVWYKYGVQKRDSFGNRGVMVVLKKPQMIEFEHMFLTREDKQLKIKFDPKISSFQRVVTEAKVDTLGSKYPFVSRNGYTDYKQFPVSGLISHFTDENGLFTTREEIYGEYTIELYDEYHQERRINPWIDVTYERDFRDEVSDFLHENTVKLFRSPTEGNILVKLMNISFTPNETLGRQIYNFSATAVEIAEANIDNYDFYGVQPIGTYCQNLSYQDNYIGQLNGIISPGKSNDILSMLVEQYQQNMEPGWKLSIEQIDYLKFTFNDKPYLITETAEGPEIIDDTKSVAAATLNSAILGYIVYINDQPIVVDSQGIYELKANNIEITSIYFSVATDVQIDYHIHFNQAEDTSQLFTVITYKRQLGQQWGIFDFEKSIYKMIWDHHFSLYTEYKEYMVSLNAIKIEADEGTIVYMKKSGQKDYERFVIGQTELLELYDEDAVILDFYFAGIWLEEAGNEKDIRPTEFINTKIKINNLDNIQNPIVNGVYTRTTDNKQFIYYHSEWYEFLEEHIVACPIEGMVDYYCDLLKGTFPSNED